MEKQIQRIVDLRQSGLAWWQIEEIVFGVDYSKREGRKSSYKTQAYALASKHKDGLAAGAFSKRVIGCFTPTQIVIKLRDKVIQTQGSEAKVSDFVFSM